MTDYEKLVIKAKDVAVEFGIHSPQYADAIKAMNREWLMSEHTPKEKLFNFIGKILWRKIQNN